MALRGTLTHWKTRMLAQELGMMPCQALGVLEALWHTTAELAPSGNIGRLPNQAIAMEMFYEGDADMLIDVLIRTRHLESHPEHRLIVHDWTLHVDHNTKRKVERRGQQMIANDGSSQVMTRHKSIPVPVPVPVPEPVPEPVKKKQIPSRDKREGNPLHSVFKGLVGDAWKEWGNPLDMPWDGSEGKHLGMLIGANPKLGPDGMRRLLQYRARSNGVNLAERPSKWLRGLTDYAKGPLNEFKQPLETSNGATYQGKTEHTVSAAQRVIQAFEDRHAAGNFGYPQAGEADRPGLPGVCE
jgi:hypothetical protein